MQSVFFLMIIIFQNTLQNKVTIKFQSVFIRVNVICIEPVWMVIRITVPINDMQIMISLLSLI